MNRPRIQNPDGNIDRIKQHLEQPETQQRIREQIRQTRENISVTISTAASLFSFTENQLRDWEKRFSLLKTEREPSAKQEGKTEKGHRQYTLTELTKLAIIKELLDHGDFSIGQIPTNFDEIWHSVALPEKGREQSLNAEDRVKTIEFLPIDVRIDKARNQERGKEKEKETKKSEIFWRFYASHALKLSLMLIGEGTIGTSALILPLRTKTLTPINEVKDLSQLGESLVGWLSQSLSSHTLLTGRPQFRYESDFRTEPLQATRSGSLEESAPKDNTHIVVRRQARPLSLTKETVEVIRRLLKPIYDNPEAIRSGFGPDMHDFVDPAPTLENTDAYPDLVLNGLADTVVQLGGKTTDGKDRWRFCSILLPKDTTLPLQQHTLVVRAQSRNSPHKLEGTTVSPDKAASIPSLSAYQSGNVIYRTQIIAPDATIAYYIEEKEPRSVLAIPIGAESGPALAVLYIVSDEINAFSEGDQRLLRLLGRIIEETILTYRARQQPTKELAKLIEKPLSVDPLFAGFLSENDFVQDVDKLLKYLRSQLAKWEKPTPAWEKPPLEERQRQYREWQTTGEVISFIAIDIDNQSTLAIKYGDQLARNLSREVGERIQGQLRRNPERQFYHVSADRYYLFLPDVTLDEARNRAVQLKIALDGNYRIDARQASPERIRLPDRLLEVQDVKVRLGISSYPHEKLKEMLQRYDWETCVAKVRAEAIMSPMDAQLNVGRQEGGNCIISFDIDVWYWKRWNPPN